MMAGAASAVDIPDHELKRIGERIFANECASKAACLTSWNEGEDFASMGIGHFIWYPPARRGPFAESFPGLLLFMRHQGIALPTWLDARHPRLPWDSRSEFIAARQNPRMLELRAFLARTKKTQALFMARRMEGALPRILARAEPDSREHIRSQFYRVAQHGNGMYILIDYVNFKGEGVLTSERYQGRGWGLLQVLEAMPDSGRSAAAVHDFAAAAERVLTRRVRNAPRARYEKRWLAGWLKRVRGYVD